MNVMKKLTLLALLLGTLTVSAGAPRLHSHPGHHGWGGGPRIAFYWGAAPYYSSYRYAAPFYSSYPAYPAYPAYCYPNYDYDHDYGYTRPNYAVSGTLLGALAGGLIGNSVHHQGWEGAGIGAAAGLVLGGIAEQDVRTREQAAYNVPVASYAATASVPSSRTVTEAPTISNVPIPPAAPSYRTVNHMTSANALFGR